jgi:hypothetical protein
MHSASPRLCRPAFAADKAIVDESATRAAVAEVTAE